LTDAQRAAILAAEQDLIRRQNEAALALQQRNATAAAAEAARLAALRAGTGTTTGTGLLGPTGATSVTGTTPFANATQGFEQNFRNYTSIPIGSQYNPNVVGGTGSPYSQVMGQMRPVGNPYANVVAGQAMGGYNPGLYDQIAAANLARAAAANTGVTLADYYGGDNGDAAAAAAAAATAADSAAASAASASGTAPGSDGSPGSGAAMGGLITNVFGPDPAGPDEGQVNMMRGEYVIKKSSVNKYGRGLLDMINEGKVPAKKLKSLLG
jgi:type II secretory pathway pseudopilin PulG